MNSDTTKIIVVGFVAAIYVGMFAYYVLAGDRNTVESIPTPKSIRSCRSCHSPLKLAAKYCPKCGKKA